MYWYAVVARSSMPARLIHVVVHNQVTPGKHLDCQCTTRRVVRVAYQSSEHEMIRRCYVSNKIKPAVVAVPMLVSRAALGTYRRTVVVPVRCVSI